MARLFRPSIVSVLSVPGRTTGRWHSAPVAVLEYEGGPYLIAAYGHTQWARNLRASGAGRLTRRRRRPEPFTAVEVPPGERPPLIAEYLRRFGPLPTVEKTFRALPDPADHPTFRIAFAGGEPAPGSVPR